MSPKNFIFSISFDLEFSNIKVWFTDQNSKPQDKINFTLVINKTAIYQNDSLFSSTVYL